MADQAINALPTKSSPSTGDKVLMIGTAEEYQILVDDLATAVLDKLTSKSYTLEQGKKTLIEALNELNSKSYDDWVQKEITVNKNTLQFNTNYSKLYVNELLKLAYLQVYFNGSVTGDVSGIITLPVTTKDYVQFWVPILSGNGGAYTGRLVINQNLVSIISVGGTVTNPFASILFPIR